MEHQTALIVSQAGEEPSLELVIAAWLDAKRKRSDSVKTATSYEQTITQFRALLRSHWLDLDGDTRAVSLLAQAFASTRVKGGAENVAATTFNNRLAIISSFYRFGWKRQLLKIDNPVDLIERRPVQQYAGARPLAAETVNEKLAAIDRMDLDGLRDYALLMVAFHTGRRAAELAGLRWGDVKREGSTLVLTWRRCKGGKRMTDELSPAVAHALMTWLAVAYNRRMATLPDDAPVWLALDFMSERNHEERGITAQAIGHICLKRIGTAKVHTLRHTFAARMVDVGAPMNVIQAKLGHSSLAVTGRYVAELSSARNDYAVKLEELYGVKGA